MAGAEKAGHLMATPHDRGIEDRLCDTLARMRHQAGMLQKDLAYRVGVSRVAVWNWENGCTFPQSLANLRKWVEAVGAKLEIKIIRGDDEFTF